MHVTIKDAMKMSTISWPTSDIAKLLPAPKSSYGRVEWVKDYGFVIYVGNTSIDEFNTYVDLCIEKGFDKNYTRTDEYFRGENKDRYSVTIEYRGYNTIFIRIDK